MVFRTNTDRAPVNYLSIIFSAHEASRTAAVAMNTFLAETHIGMYLFPYQDPDLSDEDILNDFELF